MILLLSLAEQQTRQESFLWFLFFFFQLYHSFCFFGDLCFSPFLFLGSDVFDTFVFLFLSYLLKLISGSHSFQDSKPRTTPTLRVYPHVSQQVTCVYHSHSRRLTERRVYILYVCVCVCQPCRCCIQWSCLNFNDDNLMVLIIVSCVFIVITVNSLIQ